MEKKGYLKILPNRFFSSYSCPIELYLSAVQEVHSFLWLFKKDKQFSTWITYQLKQSNTSFMKGQIEYLKIYQINTEDQNSAFRH